MVALDQAMPHQHTAVVAVAELRQPGRLVLVLLVATVEPGATGNHLEPFTLEVAVVAQLVALPAPEVLALVALAVLMAVMPVPEPQTVVAAVVADRLIVHQLAAMADQAL